MLDDFDGIFEVFLLMKSKPGSMMEKVMIFDHFLVPKCAKMGPTPTQKHEPR